MGGKGRRFGRFDGKIYRNMTLSSLALAVSAISMLVGMFVPQRALPLLLISFLSLSAAMLWFWKNVGIPLMKLVGSVGKLESSQQDFAVDLEDDIDSIANTLEKMLRLLGESASREHSADLLRQQAQIAMLQSQINPHFLYNTLEVIRSEAVSQGNAVVADMTETLSNYFRYNISKKKDVVRLEDEVENVLNYMKIQKYRFEERIHFQIVKHDVGEEVWNCLLPKLTLQPVIENAIFHGLETKIEGGTVTLHISATEKRLILIVSDDGVGISSENLENLNRALRFSQDVSMEAGEKKHTGIAIVNINQRLKLLWGDDYGITVTGFPGVGTDVTMTLPYISDGKEQRERPS